MSNNPYLSMSLRGSKFEDIKNVYVASVNMLIDNKYIPMEEKIKTLEENRAHWKEYCEALD